MMLSIIVAIAENYAIGRKGDLLCHLPNDLRHFKQITAGSTVIMGERTFFSLPKHPLPNRRNIVLTDQVGKTFDGAEAVYSIPEVMQRIAAQPNELAQNDVSTSQEAFILGGGMVYRQFMPLADKLYITHIHHTFDDADTFFPEILPQEWKLISTERHEADESNPYAYTFAEYIRP